MGTITSEPATTLDALLRKTAWVRALARHLTADASDADDLAQETWLRALRHPPREQGRLRSWLATVTRNLHLNQLRDRGRQRLFPLGEARTEAEIRTGQFSFEALLPGSYTLFVDATGHAALQAQPRLDARLSPAPMEITLPTAPRIEGQVLRADGSTARDARIKADVRIASHHSVREEARTDSLGRFAFSVRGAGLLEMAAQVEDEIATIDPRPLEAGQTLNLTLTLARGARVSGTVRFADGRPVADTRIEGQGRERPMIDTSPVRTDREGRYSLGPFLPGRASIVIKILGETTGWSSFARPEQRNAVLAPGEHLRDLDFTLPAGGVVLRGRLQGHDGKPLTGVAVAASPHTERGHQSGKRFETVTDDEGRFIFDALSAGLHELRVNHPDHAPFAQRNISSPGPEITVRLAQRAALSGRITPASGPPFVAGTVRLVPSALNSETETQRQDRENIFENPTFALAGGQESFHFPRLRAGPYDVHVFTTDGRTASLHALPLSPGSTRTLDLVLGTGCVIRGRVVAKTTNAPLEQASVSTMAYSQIFETTAGPGGTFTLPGLPERTQQRIGIKAPGFATRVLTVDLRPGAPADLGTVLLEPGKSNELCCSP